MSHSLPLPAARDRLLELASRAGLRHAVGCAALLEMLETGDSVKELLRLELGRRGMSLSGFGVLALLDRPHPDPQGTGELAEQLGLPAATISNTLARLEIDGLISRVRRPDNRRHNNVELTRAGAQAIQTIHQHLETELHRLALPLTREELTFLRQTCARLRPATLPSSS